MSNSNFGTAGLAASPNPLIVSAPAGSGIFTQLISVTYFGGSVPITGVSTSTTTNQSWLQAAAGSQQGTVSVTINPGAVQATVSLTYSGTIVISTTVGPLSVPVNMNLTVNAAPAAPSLSSLSPTSAAAAGSSFTLTVNGSGFVAGSKAQWNGAPLTTTYSSGNQLTAFVPGNLIGSPRSASVTVVNPSGATSNALPFTIGMALPSLSSLSPTSATAGGPAFTLTVNGSGFLPGSTVQWSSQSLTTTYLNGGQLGAAVPSNLIGAPGSATVTVLNPGGALSNALTFMVNAAVAAPTLSSVSPTSAPAGGPAFTLTVNGSGFLPGSTVQWNGSAVTTTYFNGTQVTASIGAALIANPGSASVTLVNPNGSVSNPVTFTIGASAGAPVGTAGGFSIITASPLPAGTVGVPYSQALSVTGGVTPYKPLAITTGSLPPGVSLTSLGGVLTGLLNGVLTTPGVFTFTVQATDNANATTSKSFSLTIHGGPPSITAIVNAASYQGASVAPGEIVVVIGSNLGPAKLAGLQQDSRGFVSTSVAGTQVLFDGVAAPLGYTEAGFVSAVVPYEVAGKSSTQVQVVYQGQSSNPVAMPVTLVMPAIFTADNTGQGQGAILNQDGSVNSANNPAAPGSIVFVFGTGEGQTKPGGVDGQPNGAPAATPLAQPVTATVGGTTAKVISAGGVPGLVAGVLEVDVQIPPGAAASNSAPVVITVGGATTQANVTLAVGTGGS